MLRITILWLAFALLLSTQALASSSSGRETLTKEQAAALVKQDYPGRILKLQKQQNFYLVRVLQTNGRVITVYVNKHSGQILREEK